jgi:transposase-like protein
MEVEVSERIGANSYERKEERTNYRNGYRDRKEPLSTSLGKIPLRIPKIRVGSYYPKALDQYKRIDKSLVTIICQEYYQGVSTRKMDKIFNKIGLDTIDRSTVSRCAQEIDEQVRIWKNRSLEQRYAYIWLDDIYTKIRMEGSIRSETVLIAIGLKGDGHREVLGFSIGNKESYYNWKEFLQSLKERGLERGELWISDDHDGLKKAMAECFPG